MKSKTGIYGGTFAPIHNGHIKAALEFKKQFALDRLLIMPAYLPPHKELPGGDTPKQRLEMLRLAFETAEFYDQGIEVCEYELDKQGKSYTVDTLRHFAAYDCELYFLVGTDMLLTLNEWKCPEEIAKLATIVFVRREKQTDDLDQQIAAQTERLKNGFGFCIKELTMDAIELSSSYIREHIADDIYSLVPKSVGDYIKAHHLYKG